MMRKRCHLPFDTRLAATWPRQKPGPFFIHSQVKGEKPLSFFRQQFFHIGAELTEG